MEIYERISQVRKALKMNQNAFAAALGFAQSTIAMIEIGKREISDRHIKAICSQFQVNEDWLLSGNGSMFVETRDDYINQLVKRYNGSEVLKKVIAAFINLNDAERQAVLKFIENLEEPTQKIWLAASSTDDQKPEIRNVPASKVRAAQEDTSIQTEDDI